MAAQYDVNLEKCVKSGWIALAAGQAPVRSLAPKISVIFGHTDKSSLIIFESVRLYVYFVHSE